MKKIIFVVALLFAVKVIAQAPAAPTPTLAPVAVPAPAPAQPVDIEIILDASGSMASKVGGESQMDIAKRAIKQTLTNIPPNVPVAFRVYAHRVPLANKAESCKDTQLLVPFQPVNAVAFGTLVDSIKPNGYTPIAYSLKTSAQDFLGKESQHVIILISDGEETCGGDPVAEAKNLLAQGFKVTINTIGFRADAKTKAQLSLISNATGGSYYDAKDAASFTQNLAQATKTALVLDKPSEKSRGQEVRGGNAYEDAKPLQTGIEYRLNHHQKTDQYDYFYVDLKKGQAVTLTISTMDKGVTISDDGLATENDTPSSGFRMMNAQFEEVKKGSTSGRHSQERFTLIATHDTRTYILIGTEADSINKNSPFKIEIKNLYDANLGKDAPDNFDQAAELAVGEYPDNWISDPEDKDFYRIPVKPGATYAITGTPKGGPTSELTLKLYDATRAELGSETSPNGAASVKLSNIVPTGNTIYLEVGGFDRTSGIESVPYSLKIEGEGAVAAATAAPETPAAPPTGVVTAPTTSQPAAATATAATAATTPDAAKKKQLYMMLAIGGAAFIGILLIVAIILLMKKKK